jgi:hypothetical protein
VVLKVKRKNIHSLKEGKKMTKKTNSPSKYTPVKISGVVTQIARTTDTKGYTVGVIETFLPTDEELAKMTEKQQNAWVKENNKRMKAICDFLNENNL